MMLMWVWVLWCRCWLFFSYWRRWRYVFWNCLIIIIIVETSTIPCNLWSCRKCTLFIFYYWVLYRLKTVILHQIWTLLFIVILVLLLHQLSMSRLNIVIIIMLLTIFITASIFLWTIIIVFVLIFLITAFLLYNILCICTNDTRIDFLGSGGHILIRAMRLIIQIVVQSYLFLLLA